MSDAVEAELKPCLRCNGEITLHENDWANPPLWSFHCANCGLFGKEWPTRDEAAADANRRALLAAVEGSALDTDQIVMGWMRARADWDSEAGDACRTILNVFMAAFPQRASDANGRDGLPFNETDLNQLRQVREELRNRWRASAFRLLDATIVDIENRAAAEGSALTPRDERDVTDNDALVLEMAKGIYAANAWWRIVNDDEAWGGPVRVTGEHRMRALAWEELDEYERAEFARDARAAFSVARPVIVEECAKVARVYRERMEKSASKPLPITGRENTIAICKADAGRSIEEDIRALNALSKDRGEGRPSLSGREGEK